MRSSDAHSLRNRVLGTVISSIVLAVLAYLWPPLLAVLGWCWAQFVKVVGLFTNTYAVPGWVLLVLVAIAAPSLWRLVVAFRRREQPLHANYVEDHIFGAIWRWQWANSEIWHLWCFCPRCDSELVYNDSEYGKTKFLCEHCSSAVVASVDGGNKSYAISAVQREIRRKVRTNQYPTRREPS